MRRRTPALMRAATLTLLVILPACEAEPTPTPASTPQPSPPAATPSASPSVSPVETATAAATPSATPAPPLSLDLPDETDDRVVTVQVTPELPVDGDGRIAVTVTNTSETQIDEIVLRWPTELGETLFLAPFVPSQERIADGGPPLVQDWTKWVIGPGERGEPDGTISLGYGPMTPGMTLPIPLFVTRNAPGPVAFDLQVLAGNALLTLEDGAPAELRVEVP
ncbi:MAG: hypothetical protein ACRDGV_13620 [Candidatus Limnocylindria bacterium]